MKLVSLTGEIVCQERPDFIITTDRRQIGVEIMEYHQLIRSNRRFPRKCVEAEWEKLCAAIDNYREINKGLDKLSVVFSFRELVVPSRNEHDAFIKAAHSKIVQTKSKITNKSVTLKIAAQDPDVLQKYLSAITVENIHSYIEWGWNHALAGVGTSEQELLQLLQFKLKSARPRGCDQFRLVLAGNGPTASTYIGRLDVNTLGCWSKLMEAFDASKFDVVAILNYDTAVEWRCAQGWSKTVRG